MISCKFGLAVQRNRRKSMGKTREKYYLYSCPKLSLELELETQEFFYKFYVTNMAAYWERLWYSNFSCLVFYFSVGFSRLTEKWQK